MTQTQAEPRRRGGRCCLGCTLSGAALIVAAILAIWLGPPLLRGLGILSPDAEQLFSGAPDLVATEAIDDVLVLSGVSGVEPLVLPIAGSTGQLAIFSVDIENATFGGIQGQVEAETFLKELVGQMVARNAAQGLRIEQVAVDFTGSDGESALTIAAPAAAFEAYAAGTMTRDEFLSHVEINFSNLIDPAQVESLLEERP